MIIVAIPCFAAGIYFAIRKSETDYLKSIQQDLRRWLQTGNPVGKAITTLEKRPLKDVTRFWYGFGSEITRLLDEDEARVVPVYLEIRQYCLLREHPHLSPLECLELARKEIWSFKNRNQGQ